MRYRRERMIVFVHGDFRTAVFGFAPAVHAGFGEQVGAAAFEGAQPAILQAGTHRGDAQTQVVDDITYREIGPPQLGNLVGTRGVGVSGDASQPGGFWTSLRRSSCLRELFRNFLSGHGLLFSQANGTSS